jgi:hypothetical protein
MIEGLLKSIRELALRTRCAKTWKMPYLNWVEAPLQLFTSTLPQQGIQLTFELGTVDVNLLLSHLEDVYLQSGNELRVGLPGGWTIFWKHRTTGSRALVAHPQADEWVATIALSEDFAKQLISSLRTLESGQLLILSSIGSLDPVSNFDWVISRGK